MLLAQQMQRLQQQQAAKQEELQRTINELQQFQDEMFIRAAVRRWLEELDNKILQEGKQ